MENVNNIWERPITLSAVQPKLTPEMIQTAESQLGYRLPAAYIELMYLQNGGGLRCAYTKDNSNYKIMGIGPNEDSITNNEFLPKVPKGLIPFDGVCEFVLCFDYRTDPDNPSIVQITMESGKIASEEIIKIHSL